MRIRVLYEDNVFMSKSIELTESEIDDLAESMYQSANSMDKLKLETPDGWVILPEEVLKKSVIFVDRDD